MANICDCTTGAKNLGQANCDAVLASMNRVLFKQRLNADGSVPVIDFSGAVGTHDATWWETYLQATPLVNRYIVGTDVDDFEFEMQDRETLETANKVEYTIHDGHIEVSYNVFGAKGASIDLYDRYKQLECGKWGINIIDDAGQLAGSMNGTDMGLIPINSVQVKYGAQANSGTIAHVMISFRIPFTFNWGSVKLFQPNVAEGDLDLLEVMPIVPLVLNITNATDASADVDVTVFQSGSGFASGAGQSGQPQIALTAANFTVTVDGVSATVATATETADGVYTLTLAAPVATGNVIQAQAVATGFESNNDNYTV
jgi:ketosteroid isomerase-like protein